MSVRILHLETSSQACSVAVSEDRDVLCSLVRFEKNVHSSALVPMIHDALGSVGLSIGDLDAVAVSIGPGSYTGLRVGLSTAKGICYASGLPLIAVPTLQSLAWTGRELMHPAEGLIVAALDARRQDAYIGVFDHLGRRQEADRFVTVDSGLLDTWEGTPVVVCGEGLEKWEAIDADRHVRLMPLQCEAKHLVTSALDAFEGGRYADLSACVPAYLKAPNITIPS